MGSSQSLLSQTYPPKPKWTSNNIPDLTGKVIMVTGGNAGIGKETVKALLQHNAKVYLAARNADKAQKAIEDLKKETGKEAIFLQLDLADLASVRIAAETFLSKEKELHVLFNNAGVMVCPIDDLTAQGYDMQTGTSVIGHHFLTKLLLPALFAASESGEKARVVTTSSFMSILVKTFHIEWIADGPQRRKQSPWSLYANSKFGNAVVANELARRFGDKIVSTSLNPGSIRTDIQRHLPSWQDWFLGAVFLYPTPMGAITQLWAGTSREGADFNGKYLIPWARVGRAYGPTKDVVTGEKLWNWLEDACKDY